MGNIKNLAIELVKNSKQDGYSLSSDISIKQWKKILGEDHYQVKGSEEVLAILDNTILKSMADGIVFTDKSIYFAEGNDKHFYNYSEIESIDSKEGILATDFIVNNDKFNIAGLQKTQVEEVVNFIKKVKDGDLSYYQADKYQTFEVKKQEYEYNDTDGKHHCTTCHAEGNIEKTYQRGSTLFALLLLLAGGVPAFFYVFFYMKSWKACSECKSENLVELGKWRERNHKKINIGKNDEVA